MDAWQCCARRNYCHPFQRRQEERGKIKGWDEKEAIGNELLGNAFFPGLMPFTTAKRQANFIMVKSYCLYLFKEVFQWQTRVVIERGKNVSFAER